MSREMILFLMIGNNLATTDMAFNARLCFSIIGLAVSDDKIKVTQIFGRAI